MRIVMAGIIGRYPWGGVGWCSLMYLLGLRALGHEVYYLEDTGECNYDPDENTLATDPRYALETIHDTLAPFGLGGHWCYVDYQGRHHGIEEAHWTEICRSADLLLVLSGGVWNWRDHYRDIPRRAFIDSDPAFTQTAIANAAARDDERSRWYVDYFRHYDALFTFGRNIGTDDTTVPATPFTWHPTWQPVVTDLWGAAPTELPPRRAWSTIMTWEIESFRDIGGNKDLEFLKVIDLPGQFRAAGLPPVELAVNGPRDLLRDHGWRCVDAFAISRDIWRYHNYITCSRAEFSVAKHTYVATRSGWFSDRTICYLAAGRPAVVQDTGWSAHLPSGEGLLAWSTAEEALEAIRRVEADWPRHQAAAREIALAHFDARRILPDLLATLNSAC